MFSKLSAERFADEPECLVGPGSYDIPAGLDEHGAILPASDRFEETEEPSGGSFYVYEDLDVIPAKRRDARSAPTSRSSSVKAHRRTLTATTCPGSKENIAYTQASPRAGAKDKVFNQVVKNTQPAPEAEQQLRRCLAEEQQLRKDDAAMAKKSLNSMRVQLVSKHRKVAELQKKTEELTAEHREDQRRIIELESERGLRKKAFYEKEQIVASLQRSLSVAKAQLEERGRRIEELSHARIAATAVIEEVPTPRKRDRVDPKTEVDDELADAVDLGDLQERLCVLEQQLSVQSSTTEEQLLTLTEAHNRLAIKARKRLAAAEQRIAELSGVVRQAGAQEARLCAAVVARQACLSALLNVQGRERREIQEEHSQAAATAEAATAQAAQSSELARLQAASLVAQVAELQGKLFVVEQACGLGESRRRELEAQLESISALGGA